MDERRVRRGDGWQDGGKGGKGGKLQQGNVSRRSRRRPAIGRRREAQTLSRDWSRGNKEGKDGGRKDMMGGWVEEKTVRINEQRLNESFQGVNRRQRSSGRRSNVAFKCGAQEAVLKFWKSGLKSPPPPSLRS